MERITETNSPRQREHKKQVAGFFMTPEWLHHPERAEYYIKRMAEDGYSVADLFWRYLNHNLYHNDPMICSSIKKIVDLVHSYGMLCILDTDYAWWGPALCEKHPECSMKIAKGEKVAIHGGNFRFIGKRGPVTSLMKMGHQNFDFLEAYVNENGTYRRLSKEEYSYEWQTIGHGFEIKGKMNHIYSGEVVFFYTLRYSACPDVASPVYLEAQKEIIDKLAAAGIDLDGFGWDEPGKAVSNPLYLKVGDSFCEFFRKEKGYDILDKLPYLSYCDDSPEAVKTRVDYYEVLNFINTNAQKLHNEYAEQVAGRKLFFGTHQTWSGIIADTAAGTSDYFNSGVVLSAAWTDGSWECDLHMFTFHMTLADSLRNELGFRDAYYNDWGSAVPAVEEMKFATRFKMLFHVNWFNSWHSDSTDDILNYRMEPLHGHSVKCVRDFDMLDKMLGNMKRVVDVGFLYNWKSVCTAPKWLARYHYTGIGNTPLSLLDQGITTNFVSPEALEGAVLKDGVLESRGRKLQALILANCFTLSDKCWEVIKGLSAAGFPVFFYGVTPMLTESGQDIRNEFAELAGVEPYSLDDMKASYMEFGALPDPEQWELEHYDSMYHVNVTNGTPVYDSEGRIYAVKAPAGSLMLLTGIDPREDLANMMARCIKKQAELFAERAYSTWFSNEDGSEKVLMLCAHSRMADTYASSARTNSNFGRSRKKYHEMRCLVRMNDSSVKVEGGSWCAIYFKNGVPMEYIADDLSVVTVE